MTKAISAVRTPFFGCAALALLASPALAQQPVSTNIDGWMLSDDGKGCTLIGAQNSAIMIFAGATGSNTERMAFASLDMPGVVPNEERVIDVYLNGKKQVSVDASAMLLSEGKLKGYEFDAPVAALAKIPAGLKFEFRRDDTPILAFDATSAAKGLNALAGCSSKYGAARN